MGRKDWLTGGRLKFRSEAVSKNQREISTKTHKKRAAEKLRSLSGKTTLHFPVLVPTGKVAVSPTIKDRWRITTNSWLHHFFAFRSVLGKGLGWRKANAILRRSWLLMIGEPGDLLRSYRKAFGIKGEGAQIISRLGQLQSQAEGHDVELVADSPQRAGWRSVCIWWKEWRWRWYDSSVEHFENSICYPGCRDIWVRETQVFDPTLRVHQTQWMGKGARYCEFIIEKKKSSKDENFVIHLSSKGARRR